MSETPISPLRQRMIEDMTVRKLGAATQRNYIRAVKALSEFLGRSPAAATAEDLRRFQADWLRPDRVRILVVGDTTLAAVQPMLERAFGNWQPGPGARPEKTIPAVPPPAAPRVFLVNKRDAGQTLLLGAHLAPPITDPDQVAMDLASSVFGGLFTSRLNMNLREDKHWSYGARSSLGGALGQRQWTVSAPVQIDKTGESIAEIQRELAEFASGERPPTQAEVETARRYLSDIFAVRMETVGSIAGMVVLQETFGLEDGYWDAYRRQVRATQPTDTAAMATKLYDGHALIVVAGDADVIGPELARFGEVTVVDPEKEFKTVKTIPEAKREAR